jgi:pimeloyl-ACP methyl ester carboxylesterase
VTATIRKAKVGREISSGLYYETLGESKQHEHALLFIHGGGSSGDAFRATPDGRLGWADFLVEQNFRVWLTDWPGTGRSGYRDILKLRYDDVVEGYQRFLRDVVREPVIILPHSMGGPITWKLLETEPDLIAGVIGIAPGYPGNLAAKNSEVLTDDGNVITFKFGDTGVLFEIDRRRPYVYDDNYVYKQAIGGSKHFPADSIAAMRAGFTGISPFMILQRAGVMPGMPIIEKTEGFRGKRIRLVAGSEDPAHTRAIEQRTADLLSSWGADAKVMWLPDHGIVGNGHFLPFELNHEQILEVIVKELNVF